MLFSTPIFLFVFLPLVLALFFATRRNKLVLLLSSLVFYAWGEPICVLLLLFVIVFNYRIGMVICFAAPDRRKLIFVLGVAADLLILIFFKYEDFLANNLNVLLAALSIAATVPQLNLPLPLGISFFTFQALAYLIDIYLGHIKPAPSLYRFALFKSFFPQLIAGPIVRYQQVANDYAEDHASEELFADGVRRFVIGFAKKVIIADSLAPVVDSVFRTPPDGLAFSIAWLGAVAFCLQIYFDFSGYTDMAIGLGRMFGIRLPENFNYPYAATSIRDFWRRWHITLSTWFRDYLYLPLGGNRKGAWRTYSNLITVFVLCGLWHGAAWNFVCWGLYHGAFLILERTAIGRLLERLPTWLRHSYTILVVLIGWVVFRSPNAGYAVAMTKAMAGLNGMDNETWPIALYLNSFVAGILVLGALSSMPIGSLFEIRPHVDRVRLAVARELTISILFVVAIAMMATQTHLAFIYFRF